MPSLFPFAGVTVNPDWITAGAAVAGTYIAWLGVDAWRQKLIGENEYRLSVRIQTLAFELQHLVTELRNEHASEDGDRSIRNRLEEVGGRFDKAFKRGRAHWGDDFRKLRKPILDCLNELLGAYRFVTELRDRPGETTPAELKRWDERQPVAFGADDDAWGTKWNQAIRDLEAFLKRYIKR